MHIVIDAKALLKALGHVQGVVERRNTIPILSNILIQTDGHAVAFTSTDLDLEMREEVEAQVVKGGSITVPAGTLFDIVRKVPPGAEIVLSYSSEDPRLSVKAGRSTFKLPVLPAGDFPEFGLGQMDSVFEIERADLAGLIDRTRFAISSEETRYYLNGLYLHLVEVEGVKKLRSVATDGHRLALAEIDAPTGSQGMGGVIIPRKTVGELRKLLEEPGELVTVSCSASKVMFHLGEAVLKSKVIDGSFPDYMRVIPRDNANRATIDVQLLAAAVDRVSTISMEKARSIKCSFDHGMLTLAVKNMEAGQGQDEMEADFPHEPLEIGFNARYLLDVASQIQGENVVLDIADPVGAVLFTDPTNPGVRFVIMPLRV